MKLIFKISSIVTLLLLFLQGTLSAQKTNNKRKNYEFEKSKIINKSYDFSSSGKLNIYNKFGNVEVRSWNKPEVKVEVLVKVTAKTESWAAAVLNDIEVESGKSGDIVSFNTLFAEDLDKKENNAQKRTAKYKGTDSRQTMNVDYIITMPISNPLLIENQFGNIVLPDYNGEVDLQSKFGELNTGSLSHVKKINVEFGKASLGNIVDADIDIKYSSADFHKLSGKIKMNVEFSNKVILMLDNTLSSLDINASYSTVNLNPVAELPASYEIKTSFGSFRNRSKIKFNSEQDGDDQKSPKFNYTFNGKSANGNILIKVVSNFSTLILGPSNDGDFNDNDKEK